MAAYYSAWFIGSVELAAQTFTVNGVDVILPAGTYYFAMRTADEVPNWSGLSNVSVSVVPLLAPRDSLPPGKIKDYR